MIKIEQTDGVQTWTLEEPPVNALSPGLLSDFADGLSSLRKQDDVAVVVLTSGLRVFSAGADARWMAQTVAEVGADGLLTQFNKSMDEFREVCLGIRRSPALFLAAIQGHTLAGGLELAAACDLRWVADNEALKIGVPEMDLFGELPSGGGGSQFLARLMGPTRALEFILNAKPVNPAEAHRLGIVDRLLPADHLLPAAHQFAKDVAAKAGRVGVGAAKRAVFGGSELPLAPAMDLDHTVHWDAVRRGRFLDGVEAFVRQYGKS